MKNHLTLTFCLFAIIHGAFSQSNISEDGFIEINGILQWVTIHGEKSKPVICFCII
jgi:hypothetical protein